MWNEPPSAAMQFVIVVGVYVLHSTLLLGSVWALLKVLRVRSFALQERLWKGAAMIPLVTAPLQQLDCLPRPKLLSWTVDHPVTSESAYSEPARSDATTRPANIDVVASSPRSLRENRDVAGSAVVPMSSNAAPGLVVPLGDAVDSSAEVPPAVVTLNETGIKGVPAPAASVLQQAASNQSPQRSSAAGAELLQNTSVWPGFLAWLIAAVAGIGLLRLATLATSLQRRLRHAVPVASGPVRACLDELLQRRQLSRPVRLTTCASLNEPAAFGLWNWSIVIPQDIGDRLGRDELAALFAHELAHLVRRDPLWLWIGRILCGLAPWQPLSFLAARRWRTAAEHLCDAWAVEQGVAPLTLARCLARVAEWRLDGRPAMGLTATGARSTLAGRIELLASGTLPADWTTRQRWTSAAIVAAALLLTCCGPRFGNGPASAEDTATTRGSRPQTSPAHEESNPSRGDEWSPEDAASDAIGDEELLRQELRSLLADLRRLDELLAAEDDSPEFQAARDGFRQRIAELERRLGEATAGAPIAPASHPSIPAPAGPVQETMP